jgi:hypothetical protein
MKTFQELLGQLNILRLKKMAQMRALTNVVWNNWDSTKTKIDLEAIKEQIEAIQLEIKEMALWELKVIVLLKDTRVTILN